MSLPEVILPKAYKNGKPLFEGNLDSWRLATAQLLQIVNLNLTQLRKDIMVPSYDFDNDGNANLGTSIQDQLNLLSSGGSPISGTSAASFTINTGGFSLTLGTSLLSTARAVEFPDSDGTVCLIAATQTLTNKTISSPVLSGTVTGTYTLAGAPSIPSIAGNVSIAALAKLYLDGGSDTYIHESAANAVDIVTGGSSRLALTTSYISTPGDVYLATTKKLYLDGGSNTYIYESAGDAIDIVTGGSSRLALTTSYISTPGDVYLATTKKLFFDGGSDTYIYESAGNTIDIVTGGSPQVVVTNSYAGFSANVRIEDSSYLYLDGATEQTGIRAVASSQTVSIINVGNTQITFNESANTTTLNAVHSFVWGTAAAFSLGADGQIHLGDVDPPTANAINANSGLKARAYVDCGGVSGGTATGLTPVFYDSYNCSSVTQSAAGIYVVNWNTDFANANYTVIVSIDDSGATDKGAVIIAKDVGSCTVRMFDTSASTLENWDFSIAAFGNQ